MSKKILLILVIVLAVSGGYYLLQRNKAESESIVTEQAQTGQRAELSTLLPVIPADASALADGIYNVAEQSVVSWEGRKVLIKNYSDTGTLPIKEGKATIAGGKITGGSVTFEMGGLRASTTGRGGGESFLEKHLKSEDFFSVDKFPEAKFEFKEAVAVEGDASPYRYTARGDLTIKGITNPVEFPAIIYSRNGELRVVAKVELDRTKWDIRFGSSKFFDNLADNVIDDMFTVEFDLRGRK